MGDIVFLIILGICTFHGIKRGFAKSFLSVASTILSMLCGLFLFRPVSAAISESAAGEIISKNVEKLVSDAVMKEEFKLALIDMTSLTENITQLISNAIAFVLSIIIIKMIISVAVRVLNLAVKLPVLKELNSLLGGALGFISGVVICYIIVGLASLIEPTTELLWVKEMIDGSQIASIIKNNNIIAEALTGFLEKK